MSSTPDVRAPLVRTLRGFAFDPSLSLRLDTAVINAMTYRVPWEELEPGPVGEYVEVIDVDPTCDVIYVPVNLCLLYTSPSPRDRTRSRMPSSA